MHIISFNKLVFFACVNLQLSRLSKFAAINTISVVLSQFIQIDMMQKIYIFCYKNYWQIIAVLLIADISDRFSTYVKHTVKLTSMRNSQII